MSELGNAGTAATAATTTSARSTRLRRRLFTEETPRLNSVRNGSSHKHRHDTVLPLCETLARARAFRARCKARPRCRCPGRSTGRGSARSGSVRRLRLPKPVMIVGIPFASRAGTIGSVPPERTSSGRPPSTYSNASRPYWIGAASGRMRPAGTPFHSISTLAPAGAASRCSAAAGHTILRLGTDLQGPVRRETRPTAC